MRFEWDESKRRENLRKHRIDFEDVLSVFGGYLHVRLDIRFDYGEDRWIGIGESNGVLLLVVFTEPIEGTVRLISARKADRNEREIFESEVKKNRH